MAVVLLAGAAAVVGHRIVGIGTAFFAKQLCSGVFVSGRAPEAVTADDLQRYPPAIVMTRIDWTVDRAAQRVDARWLGLAPAFATWRAGEGCALGRPESAASADGALRPASATDAPWPVGEQVTLSPTVRGVPRAALDRAVDRAFEGDRGTRAVVVVADGAIVAERYARGFGPDTPQAGWSMAKSVTHALVGVLVVQGRLDPDEPMRLAAWSASGDARAAITFRDALGMRTGLAFDESYGNPLADVTRMLFESRDAAGFAAARPLAAPPGTTWAYTSGTTNLISRALRERLGDATYRAFPRTALFDRIGMRSAVFEADASGTFVASSFLYATARDWARFGLLYADDGRWQGERVLPAGWVEAARTPVAGSSGRYGAHFWIGAGDARDASGDSSGVASTDAATASSKPEADAAADAFHAAGHAGQFVTIVPSQRLVVVRLGQSVGRPRWDQIGLVRAVTAALAPR